MGWENMREAAVRKTRRTQWERSATTRHALLTAAVECICEFGYASTTTAAIAERAKVTRGAVQHHFGSRDDIIIAVIDFVAVELIDLHTNTAVLREKPLRERVDAV